MVDDADRVAALALEKKRGEQGRLRKGKNAAYSCGLDGFAQLRNRSLAMR